MEELNLSEAETREEIDSTERDIKDTETKIGNINDKIERLEKASKRMEELKRNFKGIVKSEMSAYEKTGTWRGSHYETFKLDRDIVKKDNASYYDYLDAVHDAINTQKATYEKESGNQTEWLDWLKDRLIDLRTWWDNLTN